MPTIYKRLSPAGEEELGHIFEDGNVPVTQDSPFTTNSASDPDYRTIFFVSWVELTKTQRTKCLDHMADIRSQSDFLDGRFAIWGKWIVDS